MAGCAISILDVMIILLFYSPNGSMRGLRLFEASVAGLVLAVVICFCSKSWRCHECSMPKAMSVFILPAFGRGL